MPLVGAFSVNVQPVVEPMDRFAALISSQDNFHLIITAKIFINCDYNPLSLMSGHSKRYNCPLVRVTAAIDSSLQHSVPENIYCLVG